MFDLHALYCVARQMEKICRRYAPKEFTQAIEEALVERAREQILYHSDDCWRNDEDVFQVLRGFVAGHVTHWSVQAVAPEIEGDEARELLSDDTPCVAACGRSDALPATFQFLRSRLRSSLLLSIAEDNPWFRF